ncbi:hypothetical protein BKA65DRAFT_386033 [Rhexocercosporidium sp. MPI-PUGE-AT-0058]|nr:hypothetical protein BKA65DRAFT_386033 [Rhexocercosporidium sp. MPI-PUGE-AT-0058]
MDTPSRPNLKSFHFFPQLPTELRLKIYKHMLSLSYNSYSSSRILKISYSPSLGRYISNTPPPVTLSINSESRVLTLSTHSYLSLGPIPKALKPSGSTSSSSSISKSNSNHILYHFSTSPSRHLIQHLAIDFRVWAELCENGFLGIVSRMRALRELDLVVEFGRAFEGEVGFLECPSWRRDLRWVAEGAERGVGEERKRVLGLGGSGSGIGRGGELGEVRVRCVILTRGGEQS